MLPDVRFPDLRVAVLGEEAEDDDDDGDSNEDHEAH